MIHQMLCQARPNHATKAFGGMSLVLVGDFEQLPQVEDTPLYVADLKGILSNLGRAMSTIYGVVIADRSYEAGRQ